MELIRFDECLHRDWVMGKDCKREKKLRIMVRVSSSGDWVDMMLLMKMDNKEIV